MPSLDPAFLLTLVLAAGAIWDTGAPIPFAAPPVDEAPVQAPAGGLACRPALSDGSEWGERRQRDWDKDMADLCRRVAAPDPVRAFDTAGWELPPAPPLASTFARWVRALDDTADLLHQGFEDEAWDESASLAEELALAPRRLGRDVRDQPQFAVVERAARRLFAETEGDDPTLELDDRDSHAQLLRAQLLELAGRRDEAWHALETLQVHHYCANCAAARRMVVECRRSEAAERRGDVRAAWEHLTEAASQLFGGSLLDIGAASLCRGGLLLLEQGCPCEGMSLLQYCADMFPGTGAAELSEAALRQLSCFQPVTAERLRFVYLVPDQDGRNPHEWNAKRALALLEAERDR